ncbi:MAG: DUF2116 family Zn-ribbon domain-containing protein [Bacilli bacterium]|nr:DUF2116 family Zn-ribbon domain-containing protein [Bacilli bacterium]
MGKQLGSFLGADGAFYDTLEEKLQADARYKQQEKQNELIEEQTKLLKKQQLENERLEQQRHDDMLRALREETDRRDIQERYRSDKERIQRLFDDIGLNKRIYDDYVGSIFNTKKFDFRSSEKDYLDGNIEDLREVEDFLDYDEEQLNEYISREYLLEKLHNKFNKNEYGHYECLKEYILYESIIKAKEVENSDTVLTCGNCGAVVAKDADICDSCGATFVQEKEKKSFSTYMIIIGLILIFIGIVAILSESYIGICAFFGGDILAIIGLLSYFKTKENENNNINNLSLDLEVFRNELRTLINDFKKEIEKDKRALKKKMQKYQEFLQEQADDFYNFRLQHYLPKLEKLLLDMEYDVFLKDYKIDFKTVNKNNKVKNGSIEDYVVYFEENTKKYR